jgi:hypothetical protein
MMHGRVIPFLTFVGMMTGCTGEISQSEELPNDSRRDLPICAALDNDDRTFSLTCAETSVTWSDGSTGEAGPNGEVGQERARGQDGTNGNEGTDVTDGPEGQWLEDWLGTTECVYSYGRNCSPTPNGHAEVERETT